MRGMARVPLKVPWGAEVSIQILHGDCRDVLRDLPDGSVHCCVTSPPYWGLREYGTATWEGGSWSCDHVVGEIRTGLGLAALGERYRGGGKKQSEPKPMFAKGECPKCGALRIDRQIGLEQSPEEYVAEIVAVFREVRRVLRDDGVLWLNLGDAYASQGGAHGGRVDNQKGVGAKRVHGEGAGDQTARTAPSGLKLKDLIGLPWMVAFALRADGWWLRQDNIWSKRNCMPESVRDRTTRAHEMVFMLTKSGASTFWAHRDQAGVREEPRPDYRWVHKITREETADRPVGWPEAGKDIWRRINLWTGWDYFYDAVAIEEEGDIPAGTRAAKGAAARSDLKHVNGRPPEYYEYTGKRNKRSVWHVATQPFAEAHFATMPPAIVETCILAGSSERGCCPACGAPWVRQTEKAVSLESGSGKSGRKPNGKWAGGEQTDSGTYDIRMGPVVTTSTIGWLPSCACEVYWCERCALVVDPMNGETSPSTIHPVSDMCENVSPIQEGGPILQSAMLSRSSEEIGTDIVRTMPEDVHAESGERQILQQVLFSEMDSQTQINGQGLVDYVQRIQADSEAGSPEREPRRLRTGTSSGDGTQVEAASDQSGSCPSQEWQSLGQSIGKPGTNGKTSARRSTKASLHSDVPSLSEELPGSRQCQNCGSRVEGTTPAPVPCVILDCFSGAGTSLMVADRLGRDAIGIELNSAYVEMTRRRLRDDGGMFAVVM